MNTTLLNKYVWLLLAMLLPCGMLSCSDDDDEPIREPEVITPPDDNEQEEQTTYYTNVEPYVNQFCYDRMSSYYLWWKEIDKDNWRLNDDPVKKIDEVRYEEDRWSMAIENIKPYTEPSTTTTGTYGYDFQPYWADESMTYVVAVVKMVYPESPADKAGLKRGSMIMKMNGRNIENKNEDYNALLSSASLDLMVYDPETKTTKEIKNMLSEDIYLDPVLYEKTFDCGAKKVGYVFFNDFTMECNDRLIEVAKKFKQEGVSELILDLRYNGGGYVVTEELLASLLAPQANVNAGDLYQTAVYNGSPYSEALEKSYGKDYSNTYFTTKHEWKYGDKEYSYDTSDANIGLTKIYALVSSSTASASEAILVSMMPFLDVEIIGTKTVGKHCSGVMFEAEEYYETWESYLAELKKTSKPDYDKLVDSFWKNFSGWEKYVGNWGVYIMINTYADKDGNNPCRPDGLIPDVEILDNPQEPYPLGDDREALLRVALTKTGYDDFTPLSKSESRSSLDLLGKPIQMKEEGKRILLKPEVRMTFASRSLSME